MKPLERAKARELRTSGLAVGAIAQELGVSVSSISLWTRDIQLTRAQREVLGGRPIAASIAAIRSLRRDRWAGYNTEAEEEWVRLSRNPDFMFGLALYVGEGDKSEAYSLGLANCDPAVIRKAIGFFTLIGVPRQHLHVKINLHDTGDVHHSEAYWQAETQIPANQFGKTILVTSKSSQRKKGNKQPHGTCHVGVYSVRLKQKVLCWMSLALST